MTAPTVRPSSSSSSHWQQRSACAATNWDDYTEPDTLHDPEAFFPKRLEGGQCAPAKALCRQCPVREFCLMEGLFESAGVWGGLSEMERRLAQKMSRAGSTGSEILAFFDAQQPIRRRKTVMVRKPSGEMAIEVATEVLDPDAPGWAMTDLVSGQDVTLLTSIEVARLGGGDLPDARNHNRYPAASMEINREAERRRNGL